MKDKAKSLKVILTVVMAIVLANVCFLIKPNKAISNLIDAVETITKIGDDNYSALFDGDVIFSAEKVAVNSNENDNNLPISLEDEGSKKFCTTYQENYALYFNNISNGTNNKTVIDNGAFVKLDNIYEGEKYIIDGNYNKQQAIVVSFGSYIYEKNGDTEFVEIAGENTCAGITYLDVIIKKDGNIIPKENVPEIRNIKNEENVFSGLDFTYLILQQEDDSNEGFYEFEFSYMIKGRGYSANFCFYIINNTSYTKTIDQGLGYNAKPTLGWQDSSAVQGFEKTQTEGGYVRYFIGKSGNKAEDILSYPTITYDYTKYHLSYTHTANQKTTTYDYTTTYTQNSSNKTAVMNSTITGSNGVTTKPYDLNDFAPNKVNLVTIMLTEPGVYVIDYEFLYDGYVGTIDAKPLFDVEQIKLSIHGLSTYYSKTGYEGAKMQYAEIAYEKNNNVDLIIPNGHEISEDTSAFKETRLSFVYSLCNKANVREGNVITTNSKDALINYSLDSDEYNSLITSKDTVENAGNISQILSNINYVETNQGSLWIAGNDAYNNGWYYYSATKISLDDFNDEQHFSNTTSFKSKGYYLVFLQIKPNGLPDDKAYYQIFAFQYTSSSVNIELIDGDSVLAKGNYTNKEVEIRYKKPGIFDRAINPYYYTVLNQNYDKDKILSETEKLDLMVEEKTINNEKYWSATVGSDVQEGTFARYLIRLESEGESATHKLFTIDKEQISGIQPYLIREMYSGSSVYYTKATDRNGNTIPVMNAITDSLVTIDWNNKGSGANITATYSYTPFVLDTDVNSQATAITGNNGQNWITTTYKLGSSISGANLYKASSPYLVGSECVLFNQGIYLINLVDDAGNVAKYAFIIDRTANYFKVENEFVTNTSMLFGTDINFSIGNYKAFILKDYEDEDLQDLIVNAGNNTVSNIKDYYSGVNNNIGAISALFQKNQGNYYFTVKNTGIKTYWKENIKNDIVIDSFGNGTFNYVESDTTSYKRTIYVVSANQTYSTSDITDASYVTLEINMDNSLGTVYYADSVDFTEMTSDNTLDTGNDRNTDGSISYTGLTGAGATSAKHLMFVWNIGIGSCEVASVSYRYYSLKPNLFKGQDTPEDGIYYYSFSEQADIYRNGTFNKGIGAGILETDSSKGVIRFNKDSVTKAGLYIVTRSYVSTLGEDVDYGNDRLIRNYYFIVDRNGIVETGIGGSIRIELLEGETEFNTFTTQGAESGILAYDGIDNERYNIYLTTTKVPATLNIPTGKYYSVEGSSSSYRAGQLKVNIYFKDTQMQLVGASQTGERTEEIYNSVIANNLFNDVYNDKSQVFKIDIYKYLTEVDKDLRDRIAISSKNGNWLYLPGEYIIRIQDNVVDTNGGNHVKLIGFRINKATTPEVDFYNGYSKDNMSEIILVNKQVSVSQEYLKLVIPNYDETNAQFAQVDPNYIVVTQNFNGVTSEYINHPYQALNGISLSGDDEDSKKYVTKDSDGNIHIWLNTLLRNEFGEIIIENINKPLEYTVTVRYKLNYNDLKDPDKYAECYRYYDGNGNVVSELYEAVFKIIIDRETPKININNLNLNDVLVEDYNKFNGTDSMFEDKIYETNGHIYFTTQYAKYYNSNTPDTKNLYVYVVNPDTVLNKTETEKFYCKNIPNIKEYKPTLPVSDLSGYSLTKAEAMHGTNSTYKALNLTLTSFYEVVEMDQAGNATQYLIYYTDKETSISIPFEVQTTQNKYDSLIITSKKNVDNQNNGTKTLFGIFDGSGNIEKNTYFVKIEIVSGTGKEIYSTFTNLSTDFNNIRKEIVKELSNLKYKNVIIKLFTQHETNEFNLMFYTEDDKVNLNAQDLVEKNNKRINLNGANKTKVIDGEEIIFYATEIEIKYAEHTIKYYGNIEGSNVKYYKKDADGQLIEDVIYRYIDFETGEITYLITIKDVFGEISTYRFNTAREDFVVVNFEDTHPNAGETNFTYSSYTDSGINKHFYYGYSQATVKIDPTVYSVVVHQKVVGGYKLVNYEPELDNGYKIYTFRKPDNSKVTYRLSLYYMETLEQEYHITIDTQLSTVIIKDSVSGESQAGLIEVVDNKDYDDESLVTSIIGIGRMTLCWNELAENDYFVYEYRLYERLLNGEYRKYINNNGYYEPSEDGEIGLNLAGKTSTIIATQDDSTGIYRFVISIYGKEDGNFIGNRVFVFQVQSVSSQVYYVVNPLTGEEIKSIATFKYSDLEGDDKIKADEVFKREGNLLVNENVNLPLYITNTDYKVQKLSQGANNNGDKETTIYLTNATFTIFRITKDNAYDVFLGVLKVNKTHQLVKNVYVNTIEIKKELNVTVTAKATDSVMLTANKPNNVQNNILKKNKLIVDIHYNGKFVETKVLNENESNMYSYLIQGNGLYSFVFRDYAGNVHEFVEDLDGNTQETIDVVEIYVLREVVIMLNDEIPINNAFYNNVVNLTIYANSKYQTGSIEIKAFKNGEEYTPKGNNPYVFSDYGTYNVNIKATYRGEELSKNINFTILNANEARESVDLTSLNSYKIIKVLNTLDEDVTDEFKTMISKDGLRISYDKIISEYADKFNFVSGKQTFKLTYLIDDGIYPTREMNIAFTLNNESPTIDCSLKPGETTTKGFTITFNAAVIFNQIGESSIYINDRLIEDITANSNNTEKVISTTYDEFGEGDYYIKIVNSAGVVLESFKVTIKEPLNFWAIVVIIAITGVVLTVVITIIVLRRKMRIR